MKIYPSFPGAIRDASNQLEFQSHLVFPDNWQSIDVSKKPEMATWETLNFSFQTLMPWQDLDYYREAIEPNLPWADDHFLERVGGEPLNPGVQWAKWPYGHSADSFRDTQGKFSHSYMERYWPRNAGFTTGGHIPSEYLEPYSDNQGIRYAYGDLQDVINHLAEHPLSRQAFLPVWFPEDTGVVHRERVPCSIGYHFIRRGDALHVGYWLRSCDFIRHFRDDIYLTVRLALWVLDQLKLKSEGWKNVKPGMFSMWMTSLHLFRADYQRTFGHPEPKTRSSGN